MEPILRRRHAKIVVLAEYPPRFRNGSTKKINIDEKKADHQTINKGSRSEQKRSSISLTDLPANVLVEILTRLPLRTLFVARSVCKTLGFLSTPNPHFINLYSSNAHQILVFQFGCFNRSSRLIHMADQVLDSKNSLLKHLFQLPKMGSNHSWDSNNLSLLNSCNGLLFFIFFMPNWNAGDSLVCNPVTSEYIIIPHVLNDPKMGLNSRTEGLWLGFSPGTNQYKVLRVASWVNANGDPDKFAAQIFVIGSDSWRDVDDTPPHFWDMCQTFGNGLMHWLNGAWRPGQGAIISFDFERENFGEVSLPPKLRDEEYMIKNGTSIGVLGGCLCLTCNNFNARCVDLWVMRKCRNVESWTKEYVVDTGALNCGTIYNKFKPLLFLENGEILMKLRGNALVWYDPRTETLRYLEVCNEETCDYKVLALTPSLVPLKDTLKVKEVLSQLRPRYNN